MGKPRTLAFQVSEELFDKVKAYLDEYERVYGTKLTQKDFVIGLIEQALEEAEEEFEAARAALGEGEADPSEGGEPGEAEADPSEGGEPGEGEAEPNESGEPSEAGEEQDESDEPDEGEAESENGEIPEAGEEPAEDADGMEE